MASRNEDRGGSEADRETALHRRIAELEARLQSQSTELESAYALLGRERADRLRAEAALSQEQRLNEALFARSPLGTRVFDRQGFLARMNEAQRALLQLPDVTTGVGSFNALTDPLQIVSGRSLPFRRAYAGEVVELREQVLEATASPGGPQPARPPVYYNLDLVPILDGQGAVEAVIAFMGDLSEAIATREALATASQLLEGLFEHAPIAIQIFDREGFSFRMNETNRRLIGVPDRAYGAGSFNALTDPFMIAKGQAAYFARAYAGEVVRLPVLVIDLGEASDSGATGRRTVKIEQVLFPIFDDEGNVTAVVSCSLESSP